MEFHNDFKAFVALSFIINITCLILPNFASTLNTVRFYQITLIFLAPMAIIGGATIFKFLYIPISRINNKNDKNIIKALSVFLVIYFLLNAGFIYEVAKDSPTSLSLSQEAQIKSKNLNDKMLFYTTFYPEQDILGVEWISINRNRNSLVYADLWHKKLVFNSYGMMLNDGNILTNTTNPENNSFIYLFG